VSVICPKGSGATASYEQLDGIHIYRHPLTEARGAAGYLLEYITALFFEFCLAVWISIRHGFNVIHACNPPDTIFLVAGFFQVVR